MKKPKLEKQSLKLTYKMDNYDLRLLKELYPTEKELKHAIELTQFEINDAMRWNTADAKAKVKRLTNFKVVLENLK